MLDFKLSNKIQTLDQVLRQYRLTVDHKIQRFFSSPQLTHESLKISNTIKKAAPFIRISTIHNTT